MRRAAEIADWIQQQVIVASARGVVVGLSGGVDSAVVARLSQIAMPAQVIVAQPSTLTGSIFGLHTVRVDLAPAYDLLAGDLKAMWPEIPREQAAGGPSTDLKARLPLANIKPRLRMSTLYFIANSLNYLVAGTGNRSELTIGYFTKYGDGAADLLPLGRLLKSEVRELATSLEIRNRSSTSSIPRRPRSWRSPTSAKNSKVSACNWSAIRRRRFFRS